MKTNAFLLTVVLIAVFCAGSYAASDTPPAPHPKLGKVDDGFTFVRVPVDYGVRVPCIVYHDGGTGLAMSCDWQAAK